MRLTAMHVGLSVGGILTAHDVDVADVGEDDARNVQAGVCVLHVVPPSQSLVYCTFCMHCNAG